MRLPLRRLRSRRHRASNAPVIRPLTATGAQDEALAAGRDALSTEGTLKALEAALRDARRAERQSREFLADAAHQLRSPMTCIRACAETMLSDVTSLERDQLLANVVREVSRASALISGLLTLAELDQGRQVKPRPTDVVTLCRSELDRVHALAPALSIRLAVPQLFDPQFELDEHAVREILTNLLDNARRHARTRIELSVFERGATLELRVDDDGPGLAPAAAARAFDRFVTLDGRGGSGLGLAIARALARSHGGELDYIDGGFLLSLPVAARCCDSGAAAGRATALGGST